MQNTRKRLLLSMRCENRSATLLQQLSFSVDEALFFFVRKQYFKALDDCDKVLELTHVTDSDFAQAKQFPNLSAILNTCLNLRFARHLKSGRYEEALRTTLV